MVTALITHPACLGHDPPAGHPERPARLQVVLEALDQVEYRTLLRKRAPKADTRSLSRAHSEEFITAILNAIPESGFAQLDADTIASPGSGEAALHAAGAVVLGVDMVVTGEAKNAFCAVRPPGHHATRDRAMGFCLFNNIAVGALHARAVHGLKRIAVVDFDVHHGNGTQDIFASDRGLFYGSTHQWPLYPGTGRAEETGIGGNIVNVPLPAGAGSVEFRRAFETILLPALADFEPELLLVSAGFDAHKADPLAQLRLEESDFAWATERLCASAERMCRSRVVSTLEGGYDLDATARSASAHVRALMAG